MAMQRQRQRNSNNNNNNNNSPESNSPSHSSTSNVTMASPKIFATKLSPMEQPSIHGISSDNKFVKGQPIQISPFDTQSTDWSSHSWKSDKPFPNRRDNVMSTLDDKSLESFLDKEAMFDPTIHLPYAPQDWKGYEPATPLSDFIMQRIGVSGRPITTAEYMRHALTHPQYGYYTNPPKSNLEKSLLNNSNDDDDDDLFNDHDDWEDTTSTNKNDSTLIGPRGDFVTAPEVSHVFGHCICIWFVTQWKSDVLRQPSNIQLVELGPGRGTLMVDILQLATSSKLQEFGNAIQVVHLVEASKTLRDQQQRALQSALGHVIDFEFVHTSSVFGSHNNNNNNNNKNATISTAETPSTGESSPDNGAANESTGTLPKKPFSIRVEWHDDFRSFQQQRDKDLPTFMVLQEFLDALPVHSFQMTDHGWRERMIDVASTVEIEDDVTGDKSTEPTIKPKLLPRLRQVLASDPTPAVELFLEPNRNYANAPVGSVVEICPEALVLAQDMAKVLEESKGVGLIIDYGQDGTSDTLRAFSNHKQVPLTSFPGQVDVTADVDFFALRQSISARFTRTTGKSDNDEPIAPPDRQIHAFGPITQGEFLMRMGAGDMVIHSIEKDETTPEQAQRLTDALKYLVMPEHMGERYKVLAMAPKRQGIFAPAGMER